jgi:hypothetical protein
MAGNTCIGCGAEIETGATKMYCELCRPLGIDIEKRPNSMQDWMRIYWLSQAAATSNTYTPEDWRSLRPGGWPIGEV